MAVKRERSEGQKRHIEALNAKRKAEREAYDAAVARGEVPTVRPPPEPEVPPPLDPSDAREAMGRVLSGIPAGKMTPLERAYATMLEDKPAEFGRLYAAFQGGRAEEEKEPEEVAGPQEEKILRTIDSLLDEWEEAKVS